MLKERFCSHSHGGFKFGNPACESKTRSAATATSRSTSTESGNSVPLLDENDCNKNEHTIKINAVHLLDTELKSVLAQAILQSSSSALVESTQWIRSHTTHR